jgi:hypothetical protein
MAIYPCSRELDARPKAGKYANAYVSWFVDSEQRVCFYTRWCSSCFQSDVYPLISDLKARGELAESICAMCGESIDGTPSQVFLHLFPPKREQVDYVFAVCPTDCLAAFSTELSRGGKLQPDRNGRVGAAAAAPTGTGSAWDSLDL